jgi:hypothetical protein
MKHDDMTAKCDCATRSAGAIVEGAMPQVAMLRNQGAFIHTLYVSG